METKHYWITENIQAVGFILLVLLGFAYFQWGTGSDTVKSGVRDLMFLGATFYYGGSRGSSKKDETIASLSQQPTIQQTGDNPQATANPQPDETKTP